MNHDGTENTGAVQGVAARRAGGLFARRKGRRRHQGSRDRDRGRARLYRLPDGRRSEVPRPRRDARRRRRIQPLLPSAAQLRRSAQAQRAYRGLDPRRRDAGRADQGDRHRRALRAPHPGRADGGRGQARVPRACREVPSLLPRQRPRGRGGADRRQGRSLARTHRAGPSRLLCARGRGAPRRHRGARRQGPYFRLDQHQRGHRAADARDARRGQGLRGRLCAADQHAGAEAHREPARLEPQEPVRASAERAGTR